MELHSTNGVELIVLVRRCWYNAVRDAIRGIMPTWSGGGGTDPWAHNKIHWVNDVYGLLSRAIQANNNSCGTVAAVCIDGLRQSDWEIFTCLARLEHVATVAYSMARPKMGVPALKLPNVQIVGLENLAEKLSLAQIALKSREQAAEIKQEPKPVQSAPASGVASRERLPITEPAASDTTLVTSGEDNKSAAKKDVLLESQLSAMDQPKTDQCARKDDHHIENTDSHSETTLPSDPAAGHSVKEDSFSLSRDELDALLG